MLVGTQIKRKKWVWQNFSWVSLPKSAFDYKNYPENLQILGNWTNLKNLIIWKFLLYIKKNFQAFTKPLGCNNVQKSKKLTLELFLMKNFSIKLDKFQYFNQFLTLWPNNYETTRLPGPNFLSNRRYNPQLSKEKKFRPGNLVVLEI
jgi:hypothetical protein